MCCVYTTPGGSGGGPEPSPGQRWQAECRSQMCGDVRQPLLPGAGLPPPSPSHTRFPSPCLETTYIQGRHVLPPATTFFQIRSISFLSCLFSFTITWLYRNMSGRTTFLRERGFFGRFFSSSGQRGAQEVKNKTNSLQCSGWDLTLSLPWPEFNPWPETRFPQACSTAK